MEVLAQLHHDGQVFLCQPDRGATLQLTPKNIWEPHLTIMSGYMH